MQDFNLVYNILFHTNIMTCSKCQKGDASGVMTSQAHLYSPPEMLDLSPSTSHMQVETMQMNMIGAVVAIFLGTVSYVNDIIG